MKKSVLIISCVFFSLSVNAYPIDGYEYTFIRRLVNEFLNYTDDSRNSKLKPGAQKMLGEINLNLVSTTEERELDFPQVNESFQQDVSRLFRSLEKDYSIAVLDLTEGRPMRYAEHRPTAGYQPGSVGKLAVLLGFFTELNKIYGSDWEAKRALLSSKFVWCEKWGMPNSHTVPFYDIQKDKLLKRHVVPTDNFSLYEWLDHMLSVSSNAAATIVWREALYMRIMGAEYECAGSNDVKLKMNSYSKDSISTIAMEIVNEPLRKIGITTDEWRLGSFFTNGADQYVRPKGGSIGTPRGLMKFLFALEQGNLVDIRSSLEMKNLIYITDRRIRYAASPSLNDAMVYFKSGSLYKCKKDGSPCGKYKGNIDNFMNSIAIIEHDDCTTYMVALMSNVLYKNSANEHQALAAQIEKLIRT